MKRLLYCSSFVFLIAHAGAQPYIDVVAARFQHSPNAGALQRGKQPNHFTYTTIGLNAPLLFKDSSILLVGALYDSWQLTSTQVAPAPLHLLGMAFPIGFVKPLHPKWTAAITVVPRWNTYNKIAFENTDMQVGGAVLLTYKKSAALKYRFGLYYNREFFGNFWVPLLGIDWKINKQLNLFGVLPGSLVLEQKLSPRFYAGASFRALTSSYHYAAPANAASRFVRIDDNQLQAFADCYLTKKIVLTAEAGHSFFRRFRTGTSSGGGKYDATQTSNNNFLLRLGAAYRLRFD